MAYISGNLMTDERIAYTFRWHWIYFVFPVITSFALIGLPWLLYRLIKVWTSEVAVTDRRLIGKTGLIARNTLDFPLDTISSVQVDQGILGRVFNFGYLRFKNDGEYIDIGLPVTSPIVQRNKFTETQHSFKAKLNAGRLR